MFRLTISLFALSFFVGCGGGSDTPELGEVSGVVKVDGSPKANLVVTFQPEEGRPSAGRTNENGEYVLQYTRDETGAIVGKHTVMITTGVDPSDDGCCSGSGSGCGCCCAGSAEPIHAKYNTNAKDNPDMNVEVKAGSQEFDFDVETDPNAGQSGSGRGAGSGCCCS